MPEYDDSANQPVFAIPRTEYGSYVDLYRVIDLSDYQRIYIDQIDAASDHTYIVTCRNGELGAGWPQANARIILWDFEHRTEPQVPIPGVTSYWHMDAYEAKLLGYQYVPCGGHEGLFIPGPDGAEVLQGPKFDTCYIGYIEPYRRAHIANQLRQTGIHAYIDNNCWGEKRDAVLFHSRSYLHVHQLDTSPAVPALRMVVAAAWGLPVIMETCADMGIFARHALTADYAHLADFTAMWARERHTQALDETARGLHELLCVERTFRKSIEAAL